MSGLMDAFVSWRCQEREGAKRLPRRSWDSKLGSESREALQVGTDAG